jgi:N-methylhydantoinase A
MTQSGTYRFGFDIGGTFTDFVLCDQSTGRIETYKTLTTPRDPAQAVVEGWRTLTERVSAPGSAVELSIHGTTLITNALIERKGATTVLVTTQGFSDALDTQREMRYDIYDLHSPPVEPLIPRTQRIEILERMNAFGEIIAPLQPEALNSLDTVLAQMKPQAIAVTFLHSYRNPAHERLAGEWLRMHHPELSVSLSCEVAPEIREYERMSTTVANAYVQPLTEHYLAEIQRQLAELGYPRPLYLMLSSGGITVAETASRFPIRLVESGPAAGALATVFYGELTHHRDLVSFDMGGTTAKICVIKNGRPTMTNTFEIARMHRFKRGSGLPVSIPAVELIEIGAGGGSIARIDELGLLKVGPESAGAEPGPACYGRGGTQPTVTDADLLLGYLNPDYFLGGRMQLDEPAAKAAVQRVAEPLQLSLTDAAYGISRVVNEGMISATRVHVAERGVDARELRLMAFGGAGPVHADAIARALKMKGYIVPISAGVTSAMGFLTAPIAFDFARTYVARVTEGNLAELDTVYAELEQEGRATLAKAGVADGAMHFVRAADLRHVGQGHTITVDFPVGELRAIGLETLRRVFFKHYEEIYGYAHEHLDMEIVTCRLTASAGRPRVALNKISSEAGSEARALKGTRLAYFAELNGFVETPVYDRYALRAGARFTGPAIVEERDSTAVIGPKATADVDEYLNLIVTL